MKPVRLVVFEATEAELATVPNVPILRSQKTPSDFRNSKIRADRELVRDPGYVSEIFNVPVIIENIAVTLTAEELEMLGELRQAVYGQDDGAALRDVVFTWWEKRFLGTAESGSPAISKLPA